ncbi:MAG TPA: C40 family peptidase [Lachnospiraceae bacterium]|nr:C40 family peptidase [Lachnospiraceae bacterium]
MINKYKLFTYFFLGMLALSYPSTLAKASEIPVAGFDKLVYGGSSHRDSATSDKLERLQPVEPSHYSNITFANVSSYINIRDAASEEGEILGKLYSNSVAYILDETGDWYRVASGSVTGYIKKEFLTTGKEAEQMAIQNARRMATVTTTLLKVRKEAKKTSDVVKLVPIGEELDVVNEYEEWVEVQLADDAIGYVSPDYIDIQVIFDEAVSLEEEQERLDEEERAVLNELTSNKTQEAQTNTSITTTHSNKENTGNSNIPDSIRAVEQNGTNDSIREKVVAYALQFEGNPYVWGGTSLTEGADCSGFTQSVFRDNGILIPRTSRTQAINGTHISLDRMQPGDLIFYDKNGTVNHVGIYIGNGKVISASSPKTGIRITKYNYRQPYRVVSYIEG